MGVAMDSQMFVPSKTEQGMQDAIAILFGALLRQPGFDKARFLADMVELAESDAEMFGLGAFPVGVLERVREVVEAEMVPGRKRGSGED